MTAGPSGTERWVAGAEIDLAAVLGSTGMAAGTVVARGRRGVTVRARRPDGMDVAVKIGEPIRAGRARRHFLDDLAGVRGLEPSPHVVPVLDGGVGPSGHPWLVVPWSVDGSLADRLARTGPLPSAEVARVAVEASRGLGELHRQGVLHANVTPANLLCGSDGEVQLDGMAMASLGPDDRARGGSPPGGGAPSHVPPEVLEGGRWSAAGDIWALGSCLQTLLSGRPPWAREAQGGPAAAVLAMATARSPGLRPAEVPAWLSQLVDSCLAVDVTARPQDAATVGDRAGADRDDRTETAALPPLTLEGRPLGSSYLLLDRLGAGSSGQVWRAQRRWDGSFVAVKVLRPELSEDPHAVARFVRERTTLVGLDHPNLVPILDLVAEGSTLAIVMELVNGADLRSILRGGALPPAEACLLVAQMAAGMAEVHRAGVVHRDLKPENVLVEGAGSAEPRVRVTDFGIARTATGTSVTRAGQVVGTAEYLAPELVAGRPLTPAADMYSLGVLAYELLAGRRPFEADHPAAVLRAHLDAEPVPLEGIPEGLWALVARAMAKEPTARPDASELAGEMTRWVPRLAGLAARPAPASPKEDPGRSAPPAADTAQRPGRPVRGIAGSAHVVSSPPPAVAGVGPGADRPDSAEPLTAAYESWRPRAPSGVVPVAVSPPRHRRRLVVLLGVVGVAVVGAGGGLAVALNRSSPPPPVEVTADVTASVTAGGNGAVTITWTTVSARSGFGTYLLLQDGRVTQLQPAADATSLTLDGVAPGGHCYRVAAAFRRALPPGLPRPDPSKECVNVR